MVTSFFSFAPAILTIFRDSWIIMPVRSTPYPRIITAITEITALLANPEKVWAGETRPSHPSVSMMMMAITSTLSLSVTNRMTVAARTMRTRIISGVMGTTIVCQYLQMDVQCIKGRVSPTAFLVAV